jgi:hypothetical protein
VISCEFYDLIHALIRGRALGLHKLIIIPAGDSSELARDDR